MNNRTLFFFGTCCKMCCHFYTTAPASCSALSLCCHLLANLQNMPITVTNFQDNCYQFLNFIALLRLSFWLSLTLSPNLYIIHNSNYRWEQVQRLLQQWWWWCNFVTSAEMCACSDLSRSCEGHLVYEWMWCDCCTCSRSISWKNIHNTWGESNLNR